MTTTSTRTAQLIARADLADAIVKSARAQRDEAAARTDSPSARSLLAGCEAALENRIEDARQARAKAIAYASADHAAARGDIRIAELLRRAGDGDQHARRAAQAYRTDAELERAEETSRAQDFTDGGGWVDHAGRSIESEAQHA